MDELKLKLLRLMCWARGHRWEVEEARSEWSETQGLVLTRKASRVCSRCQAGEAQDPWTGLWSPSRVVTWGFGPPEDL